MPFSCTCLCPFPTWCPPSHSSWWAAAARQRGGPSGGTGLPCPSHDFRSGHGKTHCWPWGLPHLSRGTHCDQSNSSSGLVRKAAEIEIFKGNVFKGTWRVPMFQQPQGSWFFPGVPAFHLTLFCTIFVLQKDFSNLEVSHKFF